MRSLATYRWILFIACMCMCLCVGCSLRYSGVVVDAHGRPIAHANVEGTDPKSLVYVSGSPPVHVSALAGADGRFMLSSPGNEPVSLITATSPDSKRIGRSIVD